MVYAGHQYLPVLLPPDGEEVVDILHQLAQGDANLRALYKFVLGLCIKVGEQVDGGYLPYQYVEAGLRELGTETAGQVEAQLLKGSLVIAQSGVPDINQVKQNLVCHSVEQG